MALWRDFLRGAFLVGWEAEVAESRHGVQTSKNRFTIKLTCYIDIYQYNIK